MGYLRGTKEYDRKVYIHGTGRTRGVPNRLMNLQRQLNGLKPTVEFFRFSDSHTNITSSWNVSDHLVTDTFKASAQFSDSVLGDRFRNVSLEHRHQVPPTVNNFRVLVYFTRRVGTTYLPALTATGFTQIPDPSFIYVISDRYLNQPNDSSGSQFVFKDSLKGLTTIINRSASSALEKGELIVMIMTGSDSTTNPAPVVSSYGLRYTNR